MIKEERLIHLENDHRCATKWLNMGPSGLHEPIVEGPYLDDIANLTIDGLNNGKNNSKEVWIKLTQGAREYFNEEFKSLDHEDPSHKQWLKEQIADATRPL